MADLLEPAALFPPAGQHPAWQVLDVRAPVEVQQAALPFAHNLPLMYNDERQQVGICYKNAGQEAAIALGYQLVGDDLPRRVAAWQDYCQSAATVVMCWRGGLRSRLVCDFVAEASGTAPLRLHGGYKALRRYLLEQLSPQLAQRQGLVLAGQTGSGKTTLLQHAAEHCAAEQLLTFDLEAAANHRGSSFGQLPGGQPSQASFENAFMVALLLSAARTWLLEDESRNIGQRTLPTPLFEAMQRSPLLMVEEPREARAARIFSDYVCDLSHRQGVAVTHAQLQAALLRLKKPLGTARLEHCLHSLQHARQPEQWWQLAAHIPWITVLLEDYYDPLYRKGLRASSRPVAFRGSYEECQQWLTQRFPPTSPNPSA